MHTIVTLPVSPAAAASARELTVAVARWCGLDDLADDAALVVSELVTNAVRHAAGSSRVELELTGDERGIRISVADGSPVTPVLRPPSTTATSGRGLRLVQGVASRWGADRRDGGKRVWADLDAHPSAEAVLRGRAPA